MVTNSKTSIKSTRQKGKDAVKKKVWRRFIKNLDSYAANIENTNDPKIKRIIELGRDKHLPLSKAMEIAEQEFPEE